MTEEAVLSSSPAMEAPLKRKPDDEAPAGCKKPRPADGDSAEVVSPEAEAVNGHSKHGGASAAPAEEIEASAGAGEVLQENAASRKDVVAVLGERKLEDVPVAPESDAGEGEEVLSEIDSEDDDEENEDSEEEGSDDEEIDEDQENRTPKGKEPASGSKGKGKAKMEEGSDGEEHNEDDAGYLSEDPLDEVDLNNILPTRTRKRNADVQFDPAELGADEEDDDDSDA